MHTQKSDAEPSRQAVLGAPAAPRTGSGIELLQVLVVDDDPAIRAAVQRVLGGAGMQLKTACDGVEALAVMQTQRFDLVISDISMPRMDGVALLKTVRDQDAELPVILLTANPTVDSAISAVRYGATGYLTKPITPSDLLTEVTRVSNLQRVSRFRKQAMDLGKQSAQGASAIEELDVRFRRGLAGTFMVYQPIVRPATRQVFGYEALVRSSESTMPHPGALFDAAEKLDALWELGRTIRGKCGNPMGEAPRDTALFVNLHTRDLMDDSLYDPEAALSRIAPHVVLEITERASIDSVDGLVGRIERLRAMGFRIAVDDIGAGYSGLNSFASLRPEIVKLDLILVRDVHRDAVKRRIIRSLVEVCLDLNIQVVAEGVETAEEVECLSGIGCELFQGFHFARPGAPFPEIRW